MKKVLFATTALVASAGIASAEVAISGSAEMGVVGGDRYDAIAGNAGNLQFFQSVDVRFTMTGETDNGLSFGATLDLADLGQNGRTDDRIGFADFTVFVSGSFGTLTMGDTDGALDWALTETNIGGSIDDSETAHGGFNGNSRLDGGLGNYDSQIARYNYSFGDFGVAVSAQLDDSGAADPNIGIGFKYSGDLGGVTLGVGLGYQSYENSTGSSESAIGASLSAGFGGGFTAIVNYSDLGDSDGGGVSETHYGIGFGYTMDALTIGVNYGAYEEGANNQDGYGLAVNYDLGGGAVVQFGYSSTETCGVYGGCTLGDSYSLGVAMSF